MTKLQNPNWGFEYWDLRFIWNLEFGTWNFFMKKIPILLFITDRIFKSFAPQINFAGGFIKIGFYKNYAGAFSLPIGGWIYIITGIILITFFIFLFVKNFKNAYSLQSIAYSLIVFGGLSNLFDRLAYGYVIDYFNFLNFSFFNLADGMIMSGVVFLIINKRKRLASNSKLQTLSSK